MNISSILLFPIAVLYGVGVSLVKTAYAIGLLKSHSFSIPIISVGNLSLGGTGKSPHVEYILNLLSEQGRLATLSRGYGRKRKEFLVADDTATVKDIGDEPMQFHKKFPDVVVCVHSNRVSAVNKLLSLYPNLKALVLDDAFQHRAIVPGLNILLTDYNHLFINDYLFPSGKLRDHRAASVRADIIIVTKCPDVLSPIEKRILIDKLAPAAHQMVYFSHIKYGDIHPVVENEASQSLSKDYYFRKHFSVLLLSGIANASHLVYHIKPYVNEFVHLKFRDHHWFTRKDIARVKKKFSSITDDKKIIITTEKDLMRLQIPELLKDIMELPLFYIPVSMEFKGNDGKEFERQVIEYVRRAGPAVFKKKMD